jgi:holo-[acyl-carrier protein] synthase
VIFGIGTDVVQLARVEDVYARHGEHFVRRLLMPEEETAFRRYKRPVRFLAMRFAAKEAIVKALGTGFAHGVWIRDVGITPNAWGRPEVIWSERGREVRDRLGAGDGHVTLTDEAGLVVAVAVLLRRVENVPQ